MPTAISVETAAIGARDKNWLPKKSEDRHISTANVTAVIDGATSVNPDARYGGLNPAEFAAEFLSLYIKRRSHHHTSAKELLTKANTIFRKCLSRYSQGAPLDFASGPSAAAALVMFHGDHTFDVAACADCVVCARTHSGTWVQLTRDLIPVARAALERHVNVNQAGISAEEKQQREALLKKNTFRRNFIYNNDCAVFNGDPKFVQCGKIQATDRLPISVYSHLVIMSDGAFAKTPLETCQRLELSGKNAFNPTTVAEQIFAEKGAAREIDRAGKAFDDLTLSVVTLLNRECH
jgi:hypothetical protein